MAKKRRKDKEEETYEFVPPDFDEKEFIRKELSDTKAVIIIVGYGILFGILAAVVASLGEEFVAPAILVGVVGAVTVKYFYAMINIDTSGFTKKNWAGNIATFFFTFLAVFVISINYPFIDYSDPDISGVIVWVDDGTNLTGIEYTYSNGAGSWVPMDSSDLESIIVKSEDPVINITAKISDTAGIATAVISIGSSVAYPNPMQPVGDGRYEYTMTAEGLSAVTGLNFYIVVSDQNKNEQTFHPELAIPVIE